MLVLYSLGVILCVILSIVVFLEIKVRKQFNRAFIEISSGVKETIPCGDPVLDSLKGIYNLLTGKLTPATVMKMSLEENRKDRYGAKHRKCLHSWFILRTVVIWDIETAKSVLFAPDTTFPKANIGEVQNRLVGHSILQAKGEEWKKQKTILSPAFKWGHIQSILPHFQDIVAQLVAQWQEIAPQGPIDVRSWIQRATIDAIGRGGFGFNFHALENNQTKELLQYESFMKEAENPVHQVKFLDKLLGSYKTLDKRFTEFEEFMQKLISVKRERIVAAQEQGDWSPEDILDYLLGAHTGSFMTDREIMHNMNTFFIAGQETTAGALNSLLHLLARNPEAQEKVRKEILTVCGDDGEITIEAIRELHFLEQCLKETLRLIPPAPIIIRETPDDVTIGKLTLPKGTLVAINTYFMHHDKTIWGDNCDEFVPERFAEGATSGSYLPFSLGSRQCIGNNFAMLEMKTFAAKLLQKFTFAPDENSKVPYSEHIQVVLSITPGCTLKVTPQ